MIFNLSKVYENELQIYIEQANGDKVYDITRVVIRPKLVAKYNNYSEFSFTIPSKVNGVDIEAFDYVDNKRRLVIANMGRFTIDTVNRVNDGVNNYKEVTCKSVEYEMNNKSIGVLKGTLPLWSDTSSDDSVMKQILALLPKWSIGTVEEGLKTKRRTFDVKDQKIYNFLVNDIENAYDCVFDFDTLNYRINIVSIANSTTDTDIIIDFDTLLKQLGDSYKADEITTVLDVTGGNLDIRRVNPTGTNFIYDFTYYKTLDWMSQGLIDAITTWDNKRASYVTEYSNLLTQYISKTSESEVLNAQYPALYKDYKAKNDNLIKYLTTRPAESDPTYQTWLQERDRQFYELNQAIDRLEVNDSRRQQLNNEIKPIDDRLKEINGLCKYENNFTLEQRKELEPFYLEGKYENKAFAYVKGFTEEDKQSIALALFEHGKIVIQRMCKPRVNFDIDMVNILAMSKADVFKEQLSTGSVISIVDKNTILRSVLMEISLDLQDFSNLELTFSDKLRDIDDLSLLNEMLDVAIKNMNNLKDSDKKIEDLTLGLEVANTNIGSVNNRVDTANVSISNLTDSVAELKNKGGKIATYTSVGSVMPNQNDFMIGENGLLTLKAGGGIATYDKAGIVKPDYDFDLLEDGTVSINKDKLKQKLGLTQGQINVVVLNNRDIQSTDLLGLNTLFVKVNKTTPTVTSTTTNTSAYAISSMWYEDAKANGVDIYPTSITLDKQSAKVQIGKTITLIATVLPANSTDKVVSWATSDGTIATVSSTGVVTGVKLGTCTISAKTVNGLIANCTLEVANVIYDINDNFDNLDGLSNLYYPPHVDVPTTNFIADGILKPNITWTMCYKLIQDEYQSIKYTLGIFVSTKNMINGTSIKIYLNTGGSTYWWCTFSKVNGITVINISFMGGTSIIYDNSGAFNNFEGYLNITGTDTETLFSIGNKTGSYAFSTHITSIGLGFDGGDHTTPKPYLDNLTYSKG